MPGGLGPARLLVAAALVASAGTARAACCIFEDPLLAIGDVSGRGGALRLAVDSEVSSTRAAMEMDGAMADETVRLATLRVTAAYSPLERLSLVATIPFARREWRSRGMEGQGATLAGIGDVDVGGRLALWRQVEFVPDDVRIAVTRVQAIALAAGLGLPTGENRARAGGARLVEMAQIGSGAWATYAGLAWQLQREPWAASVSVTGRVRTTNPDKYRFGPGVVAGAELVRDVWGRVSVGVGADVRAAAPDRDHGAVVPSTGGLLVSATPLVAIGAGGGVQLRVRAQLPVLERLHGDQRVGVGVLAGLLWATR